MSTTLNPDRIAELLAPYTSGHSLESILYSQLIVYLELILKWNTRINLTAIRNPEEIVRRHFGESLFAGLQLNQRKSNNLPPCNSLLDLGSGPGFPGIPIQLLYPDLPITLAESRIRKAAFLHEVIRTLGLKTEVWANRAESMPPARIFHTVTLRAVDQIDSAIAESGRRAQRSIVILGNRDVVYPTLAADFVLDAPIRLPNSHDAVIWIANRTSQ